MSAPRTAIIDCDGPLADFVGAVLEVAHTHTSLRWKREDLPQWDIFALLRDPLNPRLYEQIGKDIDRKGFCERLRVVPGAKVGIQKLRDMGFRVECATAPWKTSRFWMGERLEWLMGHFGFRFDEIKLTAGKDNIHGAYLLDDKTNNVRSWQQYQNVNSTRAAKGVVFATPHNVADNLAVFPDLGEDSFALKRTGWEGFIDMVKP